MCTSKKPSVSVALQLIAMEPMLNRMLRTKVLCRTILQRSKNLYLYWTQRIAEEKEKEHNTEKQRYSEAQELKVLAIVSSVLRRLARVKDEVCSSLRVSQKALRSKKIENMCQLGIQHYFICQ